GSRIHPLRSHTGTRVGYSCVGWLKRNVLVPQGGVLTDALSQPATATAQKHLSLSRPRKAQCSSRILPPSAAAALAMNAPTSIANAVAIDTRAACFLAVSAICRNFCCESFN